MRLAFVVLLGKKRESYIIFVLGFGPVLSFGVSETMGDCYLMIYVLRSVENSLGSSIWYPLVKFVAII